MRQLSLSNFKFTFLKSALNHSTMPVGYSPGRSYVSEWHSVNAIHTDTSDVPKVRKESTGTPSRQKVSGSEETNNEAMQTVHSDSAVYVPFQLLN